MPRVLEKVTDLDNRTFKITLDWPLTDPVEYRRFREWVEEFHLNGLGSVKCEILTEYRDHSVLTEDEGLVTLKVLVTFVWIDFPRQVGDDMVRLFMAEILKALLEIKKIGWIPPIEFFQYTVTKGEGTTSPEGGVS